MNHTNIGTSTDLNVRYVLAVPGPNAVLVFTLIGFETQEVPVGEQSTVNIEMKVSTSTLEDVVVVAFGEQQKTDVIGDVKRVKDRKSKRLNSSHYCQHRMPPAAEKKKK